MTKYILVTGGVVSSVGKGVAAAAIGRMLKERGLSVSIQKLDPYINVDPGTMSPYQHGEVFVTEDGAETDLDLGHYERFIDINLKKVCNITTGQVYAEVIAAERRGDYLGGTIQVIPHITNEIKRRIGLVSKTTGAEIVIVEVGGTVGDIESLPFLEALRQLRSDVGRDNTLYVHVTLLPHIGATNELKTKPTQHSVRELRSIGISPDIIIARSDYPVASDMRAKIALFCDVPERAVIPLTTSLVPYDVPLTLETHGLGDYIVERLGIQVAHKPDWSAWRQMTEEIRQPKKPVRVAVVGKYVELQDAYMSVREALKHAGLANNREVQIEWLHSSDLEKDKGWDILESVDGVIVPGGFGERGIEGMILAANYARTKQVPYLGLCLGMQIMCIELGRAVLGSEDANSSEFDHNTPHPIIDLMADQRDIASMGGTMRLGNYPCHLVSGTKASDAYSGQTIVQERHRHRWEFNNAYRQTLTENGLVISGLSPDGRLVEISELANHPFMVGSQFHPEFTSRPNRPNPLFKAFVAATAEFANARDAAAKKTRRAEVLGS
jgi:CTP synthase